MGNYNIPIRAELVVTQTHHEWRFKPPQQYLSAFWCKGNTEYLVAEGNYKSSFELVTTYKNGL